MFKILLLLSLISLALGETHVWNYTAEWVDANPDGNLDRKVIGFNGEWPLPVLRVKKNDRVEFYLTNGLEDANTTLHFHGLFQPGSAQMDGPEMITQCPIPPGETFLYNFTVGDQVGTYWYHSHSPGQTGDGMRGVFIIEDDDLPYDYDEEVVITVADWYHKNITELIPDFLNLYNPTGAEPIPQNILLNDTRNNTWNVEPNKTYLARFVNIGGFVSQYIYMEGHEFEIIEIDGVYVEPQTTEMLYITVAQRYTVLIKTKDNTDNNYAMMTRFDIDMLDVIPSDLELNLTSYIVYDSDKDLPGQYYVDSLDNFFDDFTLQPTNNETLFDDPDYKITVDVAMDNLGNGINYAFFNNITYTYPKVPTLMSVLSGGDDASDVSIYGSNTNSHVLQHNDVIDIVVNNLDTGKHPFHLHGHVFQVIARGEPVDDADPPVAFDYDNHTEFPEIPMQRDVVYVNPQSYIVLRFKADHPGVWFFHCHIDWHLIQGLALQLIEAPDVLIADPEQQITQNHIDVCKAAGVPYEGNAAANTKDFLDLSGENTQHKPLPSGFTARGIVALVFSCIAAVLGLIAITIYGLADIKNIEEHVAEDLHVDISDAEDEVSESRSSLIENRY
ncbi:iron transport multicopper oxidase Fet3p [[Candida] jaroonii]|uniref:Iron transport multicopper oxidase Fet3p n=1 Tax=[Candida] jaroonii TaxID=467808 RepID=A0ACA9Y469_9ASCO|nr:iron transport multicopper oxidase Fet3p [[Candida] jaroonii]